MDRSGFLKALSSVGLGVFGLRALPKEPVAEALDVDDGHVDTSVMSVMPNASSTIQRRHPPTFPLTGKTTRVYEDGTVEEWLPSFEMSGEATRRLMERRKRQQPHISVDSAVPDQEEP